MTRRGWVLGTAFAAKLFLTSTLIISVSLLSVACEEEIDVTTEEGLKRALKEKKKLPDAISELKSISSDREKLAKFGDELMALYLDGSEFDKDVLRFLTLLKDAKFADAYIKATKSGDPQQVRPGATMIGELKIAEGAPALVEAFNTTMDTDMKEAVLEAGAEFVAPEMKELAAGLLRDKEPGDVPIAQLRKACKVLTKQAALDTAPVLVKAMYYVDQVNRDIFLDCSSALLAIGPEAAPEVLKAMRFENDKVNSYISRNSDRRTKENIVLGAVTVLSKMRTKEAVPAILDYLEDKKPITPPEELMVKPDNDPEWGAWAGLVGQVTQESIFALNDMGIAGDERAKKVLMELYLWTDEYRAKYATPYKYQNMVEVAARVNAVKVLAENGFLDDDETRQQVLDALKAEDFSNEKKLRPAIRAGIVPDLVTYLAIASKPGWEESVWPFFDEMTRNEFVVDPKGIPWDFAPPIERIGKIKTTFALASECADTPACYAKIMESTKEEDHFRRVKAVYELGRSGINDPYFDLILNNFDTLDAFGYMFAADALVRLGTAADVDKLKAKYEKWESSKDAQVMMQIKGYILPMMSTLQAKGK